MQRLLFVFIFCSGLFANISMAEPQLGKQFNTVAKKLQTDNPNKIEVMELFWYGCSHCYAMEQPLSEWVKKLPGDVYFKRMPALGSKSWIPLTDAYFTIQDMEVSDIKPEYKGQLHKKLFVAIHELKELPTDVEGSEIDKWLARISGVPLPSVIFHGLDHTKRLNEALHIFRDSGATSVPTIVVNGQYVTSPGMAGGYEASLETANFLIDKIRKEQSLKKQ